MITVQMRNDTYRAVTLHLQNRQTEQVAFLFLSYSRNGTRMEFAVQDHYVVPPSGLVHESRFHAEVSEEAQANVIKAAWDRGLCLGEIHSHPGDFGEAAFSPSDLTGFHDFVPHIWWRLKGKPYVAFVFGRKDFDALAWVSDPHSPVGVDRLVVEGMELLPTGRTIQDLREREERKRERYSRQTAFFGAEGQRKLAGIGVGIVGLGGLGSHVAQQLAYLGVRRFVLIDADIVTGSSLNRLVGATETDVGRKKVDVTCRLIRNLQEHAEVLAIDRPIPSHEAFNAVQNCDFVFGCVDNDGVRLILLETCCSLRKPYLDIATEIPDTSSFGGRVIFTGLGKGCPMCRSELDQKEIWRFFATDEQRAEDDRVYGVNRSALGTGGPSVVSLNGIVASLGVTEFMVHFTGVRPPFPHLVYRGEMGTVNRPQENPPSGCYYCDGLWNGRGKTGLGRYVKGSAQQDSKCQDGSHEINDVDRVWLSETDRKS